MSLMVGPTVVGQGGGKATQVTVEIIDEITGIVTKKTLDVVLDELTTIGGPLLGRAIDGPASGLDQPIDSPE